MDLPFISSNKESSSSCLPHNTVTQSDVKISSEMNQSVGDGQNDLFGSCNMEGNKDTMYCLSCPYSDVSVDKMKCHTFEQHPTGIAVVTNSHNQKTLNLFNVTFFCVKERCTHFTTRYNIYEEHIMSCCFLQQNLSHEETERLKLSVQIILDLERVHFLRTFSKFLDMAFSFHELHSSIEGCVKSIYGSLVERTRNFDNQNLTVKSENLSMETESSSNNRHQMFSYIENCRSKDIEVLEENQQDIRNNKNIDINMPQTHLPISDTNPVKDMVSEGTQTSQTAVICCDEQENKQMHTDSILPDNEEILCEDGHGPNKSLDIPKQQNGHGTKAMREDDHSFEMDMSEFISSRQFPECHVEKHHSDENIKDIEGCSHVVSAQNQDFVTGGPFVIKNLQHELHNNRMKRMDTDIEMESHEIKCGGNSGSSSLHKHKETHIGDKFLKCDECRQSFADIMELTSHVKTHTGVKMFVCNKCGKIFRDHCRLRIHDRDRHKLFMYSRRCTEDKRGKCHLSEKNDIEENCLTKRMKKRREENISKCNVFGKTQINKYSLAKHIKAHPEGNPFDTVSGQTHIESGNIIAHDKFHTTEDTYKYKQCFNEENDTGNHIKMQMDKVMKSSIPRHMKLHIKERSFQCHLCDKSFYFKNYLTSHMKTHSLEKPFECDVCGKCFTRRSDLRVHMRTHSGEKPYKCKECNTNFCGSGQLVAHMRTHTGEKPYLCNMCGQSFGSGYILRNHIRTHTGEKPYMCVECGASFRQKDTLKYHLRIHTGEKPHLCTECGQSFRYPSSYYHHMKKHKDVKPWKCVECGKYFPTLSQLWIHKKQHAAANGRPFECTQCDKSYACPTGLAKHKKRHHKNV